LSVLGTRVNWAFGLNWSWIVPPISGGLTLVFHRYYDTSVLWPAFVQHHEARALARGDPIP
jgi:nitric oxide synthase oxygenase domain/subunit